MTEDKPFVLLHISGKHFEIVSTLSTVEGISFLEALEYIVEQWEVYYITDGRSLENQNSPLDQIEAKLERISGLCDQSYRKIRIKQLVGDLSGS
jgi:hypothetical protein